MKISIIVAMDKKRGIGKGNKLLWQIPQDMKRFKKLTTGHVVIMGRKTWESLPVKPLPNRYNIVITRDLGFKINDLREGEGFVVAGSLEEALRLASLAQAFGSEAQARRGDDECFVIGGGQVYQQAIGLADKLYLTIVDATKKADTFFPDYSDFKKVVFKKEGEWEEYKYRFEERER